MHSEKAHYVALNKPAAHQYVPRAMRPAVGLPVHTQSHIQILASLSTKWNN